MPLDMDLQPAPETPSRGIETLTGRHPLSGVVVGNLSPAFALELGMPAFSDGVVVTEVVKGSVAERYGMRPRDILFRVNGAKILDIGQAKTALQEAGGRWQISIRRNGRTLSFKVNL